MYRFIRLLDVVVGVCLPRNVDDVSVAISRWSRINPAVINWMARRGSLLHDALPAPPPVTSSLLRWLGWASVQTPADVNADEATFFVVGGDALVGYVDLGQTT